MTSSASIALLGAPAYVPDPDLARKERNQRAIAIYAYGASVAEPDGAAISDPSVQGWVRGCILRVQSILLRPIRIQPLTETVGSRHPRQFGQFGTIRWAKTRPPPTL